MEDYQKLVAFMRMFSVFVILGMEIYDISFYGYYIFLFYTFWGMHMTFACFLFLGWYEAKKVWYRKYE